MLNDAVCFQNFYIVCGYTDLKSVIRFGIRSVFNPATGENWWFVTVYFFLFVTAIWLAGSVCWYISSYIAASNSASAVWFASLDIGSIKWINNIAGTTFGVYLIHDADISRALIWHTILRVDTVQYTSTLFPIYAILSIVGVFCCCSLIDLGRKKWIEPWATERFQGLMKRAKYLLCE